MRVLSFATLSVKRPVTTAMVFLAVVLMGLVAYTRLPVQLVPDVTFPGIGVYVRNQSSTEENLNQLTRPIEGIIAELSGVREMTSRTRDSSIWIEIEFDAGTDIQYTVVELQDKLIDFQQSLENPRVAINSFPFSTSDWQRSFMYLSVRGDGDVETLFRTAAEKVESQLKSINGVSNVEISGLNRNIAQVEMNSDLLASYGLELGQVIGKVQAAAADDQYLGSLDVPQETHYVRLDDRVRTVEELAEIHVDEQGLVKLKDVSNIFIGDSVDRRISRSNGKNSLEITLEREADQNLIDLARRARERIKEIDETLPEGVSLEIDVDFASFVEEALSEVKRLALIGALLALIVPLVFFRSFRVSMIVFVSVPISLIAVFNLFYALNVSINIFSIVGLALGVGLLVDSSIVVVENSFRLYEEGYSARDSAGRGGGEVGRGLVAATLTSVIVFLPFSFLDSEFSLMIKEPILALVFPLLVSLVVALTLVPVLAWLILKSKSGNTKIKSKKHHVPRFYRRSLAWVLRHRMSVLAIIGIVVSVTWLESWRRVDTATTSQEPSRDWHTLRFRVPAGATLSDTDRAVRRLESELNEFPELERFGVSFDAEDGRAWLKLKPKKDFPDRPSTEKFRAITLERLEGLQGMEVSWSRFDRADDDSTVRVGSNGELEFRGLDDEVIYEFGQEFAEAVRSLPGIVNAEMEKWDRELQYVAKMEREALRQFDVSAATIARYISSTRSGGSVSSLQLENGDERTDVSIYIEGADGNTLKEVSSLPVQSASMGEIPLSQLVNFLPTTVEDGIRRRDRQASEDMDYYYEEGYDRDEIKESLDRLIENYPNPAGIIIEHEGETRRLDERMQDFFFCVLAGALLVYIVMAGVFESLWIPFTILATNPLMLIGIVWGLDIANLPLDDLAAFGVILLIGLAVNNGIVLLDRALGLQEVGYTKLRSIYEASLTRLRPIMMTYLTTVLGLLPLALFGEAEDQWRPVAVVVIGGLTSATILTLLVLPCLYLIGDDIVSFLRKPLSEVGTHFGEIPVSLVNLFGHPIQTLKGKKTFFPHWRKNFFSIMKYILVQSIGAIRILLMVPFDLISVFRSRKRSATGTVRETDGEKTGTATQIDKSTREEFDTEKPVLELSNIQVEFSSLASKKKVQALKGIDLEVQSGLFGLLGPNGSGKTTLMRVISGILPPTRGSVYINGEKLQQNDLKYSLLFGYFPQQLGRMPDMSLYKYLDMFALLYLKNARKALSDLSPSPLTVDSAMNIINRMGTPAGRHETIINAVARVNLRESLNKQVSKFSGGMQQRAGFAKLLIQSPRVMLVDEPTAGLDPLERVRLRMLLAGLAEDRLVIFSTHIIDDLEGTCDAVALLREGELIWKGLPGDLSNPPKRAGSDPERSSLEARVCELLGQDLPAGAR